MYYLKLIKTFSLHLTLAQNLFYKHMKVFSGFLLGDGFDFGQL